ncbi:MAG: thioredoxin domain-containing protein [Deltaproteobacteria bacterium]|nr:thioredoxin domain-containing protein [Deltaproteobacteria bacterium]
MNESGNRNAAVDTPSWDWRANPQRFKFVRVIQIVILLVCLTGLGVAVELTHIHYESHTNPAFKSICAINEAVNCETVARSPWSVFAGLPISVWGMLAYLLFVVLETYSLLRRKVLSGFHFVAFSGALVASGLLAYISTVIIKSLCLFCTTLYVVNTTLFILGLTALYKTTRNPLGAIVADVKTVIGGYRFFAPLALLYVGLAIATYSLIPVYWQTSKYDSLPAMDSGVTDSGAHWIGAKNPKVTIVEFSDHECPFCRRAHYHMRMMVARHKNEVRLVHRHMPMDNKCNEYLDMAYHERACEFAAAVECAGEQGKYWEMNDAVFGAQENASAASVNLDDIFDKLELDGNRIEKCMSTPRVARIIGADIDEGTRRQIPGTPTYFIGAQPYPGAVPEQTVINLLKRIK